MGNRDYAIDVLKCIAVLFIFNAHSTILYPVFPWLSTGGYAGDALFFFCSGFTLLLAGGSRLGRFDTWYKRRLSRIWPSTIAFGLVVWFVAGRSISVWDALSGVGWFVKYILIVYIAIWILGKFCIKWMNMVFVISIALSIGFCFMCLWTDDKNPEHWKWPLFFPVMLLGAIVGKDCYSSKKTFAFASNAGATIASLGALTLAVAVGSRFGGRGAGMKYFQMLELPFLLSFVFYGYRAAKSAPVAKLMASRAHGPILWVGGLCLDFYLIKWTFVSDALNFMFPLNLPVMLLYLLLIAYLNHSLGHIIQQTLLSGHEPYDWKAVFKV